MIIASLLLHEFMASASWQAEKDQLDHYSKLSIRSAVALAASGRRFDGGWHEHLTKICTGAWLEVQSILLVHSNDIAAMRGTATEQLHDLIDWLLDGGRTASPCCTSMT